MQIHSLKIERASVVLAIKIIFLRWHQQIKEPQNMFCPCFIYAITEETLKP